MIKGNVDKITNLSLDLLNYAKDSDLDFQAGDPNEAGSGRSLISCVPRARELGINLNSDFSPDQLNTCHFDADLIYRCLLNLVTNAIDACIPADCRHDPRQNGRRFAPKKNAWLGG